MMGSYSVVVMAPLFLWWSMLLLCRDDGSCYSILMKGSFTIVMMYVCNDNGSSTLQRSDGSCYSIVKMGPVTL